MIKLTKMNRTSLILNSDLIEHIEETPDTVITLTNGQKLMVQESAEDIVARVLAFRSALANRLGCAMVNSQLQTTLTQGPVTDGR